MQLLQVVGVPCRPVAQDACVPKGQHRKGQGQHGGQYARLDTVPTVVDPSSGAADPLVVPEQLFVRRGDLHPAVGLVFIYDGLTEGRHASLSKQLGQRHLAKLGLQEHGFDLPQHLPQVISRGEDVHEAYRGLLHSLQVDPLQLDDGGTGFFGNVGAHILLRSVCRGDLRQGKSPWFQRP